jgi:hypothetical protein
MDHAVGVRVLERLGHLAGDQERFLRRDRPLCDPLRQGRTLDQLHDERQPPRGFFLAVEDADARVMEGREEPGLALESRRAPGVGGKGFVDELESHVPPEMRVVGTPDLPHPAGAEAGNDLEGTEAGSARQAHRARLLPLGARPGRRSQ